MPVRFCHSAQVNSHISTISDHQVCGTSDGQGHRERYETEDLSHMSHIMEPLLDSHKTPLSTPSQPDLTASKTSSRSQIPTVPSFNLVQESDEASRPAGVLAHDKYHQSNSPPVGSSVGSPSRDRTSSYAPAPRSESTLSSRERVSLARHLPLNPARALPLMQQGRDSRPPWTAQFRARNPPPFRRLRHRHHYHNRATRSTSPDLKSGYSDNTIRGLHIERLLWAKVERQRQVLGYLRAAMANKRNEVRKFRHAKDTADDAFLNKLMPYLTSGEPVAIVPTNLLMEGVGAMQNIRKTHYSVEHDYEHMEQHLDREESKLFDLEADLFHFLSGPDDIDRRDWKSSTAPIEDVEHDSEEWDDKNDDDNQSTSRISLLGITGELKGEIHPLYRDLADAVGECELAKEHLDELWNHHEKLLEELELNVYRVRNEQGKTLSEEELDFLKSLLTHIPGDAQEFEDRFGFEGDEDDLEFFQDYSLREAQAQKNLEEATQKANQLMQICSEKGVMRRNPEFNEEYTIYLDASLPPGDNMTINLPTMAAKDLANPRFPMLLSNPSHVLDLLSPIEALQRAMKLSKDDPNDQANFRQKVACMKEMGISMLMKNATNTPDYISEWLVHKLRTSPLEAELLFSICEGLFKITDRHKWQEQVLQHWQSDGANSFPHGFEAPLTPNYEVPEIEHVGGSLVNSAITVTPAPPAEPPAEEPPAEEPPAAEPPAAEPQDEAGPELTTKT